MGFEFEKKPTIEICGKEYECDICNSSLIAGVARDFPKILEAAARLQKLQGSDTTAEQIIGANESLILSCKSFIEGCLGEDEYQEIFKTRRPNNIEHVSLSTYLFEYIMSERQKLLNKYLDLPKAGDSSAAG